MTTASCWVVVPAAGIGSRMQANRPKQYLPLAGTTVLEYTLRQLLAHRKVKGLIVSVAEHDEYWPVLKIAGDSRVIAVAGGQERCHSVLNGLKKLMAYAGPADWVMVHDVARPCLSHDELDSLFDAAETKTADGFVLGMSVRDTMKQTTCEGIVEDTPDRNCLWHAFTPQMFRLGELLAAIDACLQDGKLVTDEASAMEQCGHSVQMVSGSANNIKITRPEDLPLAEFILGERTK
ncbi:MAG: 2-C-methyl-D-erythritol 4-phosphate cytidylyltransferase [Pseudomonadales bacterium]